MYENNFIPKLQNYNEVEFERWSAGHFFRFLLHEGGRIIVFSDSHDVFYPETCTLEDRMELAARHYSNGKYLFHSNVMAPLLAETIPVSEILKQKPELTSAKITKMCELGYYGAIKVRSMWRISCVDFEKKKNLDIAI